MALVKKAAEVKRSYFDILFDVNKTYKRNLSMLYLEQMTLSMKSMTFPSSGSLWFTGRKGAP